MSASSLTDRSRVLLEQLVAEWWANANVAGELAAKADAAGNAHACLKERRIWQTCARQLADVLVAIRSFANESLKTEGELLHELQREAERSESDAALAKAFGVTRSHMSRVLRGLKPITAKIAHGLGYEEQRRYVR